MTATPKSLKSESLNGSWCELENNESPYHHFSLKNSGRESENSSFEKIMMDVQNELIALSSNRSSSSCKEQLQQLNQKLSSKASELQLDPTQFKLDQLETFEDERFQKLNSELYWYWGEDSDGKNFFNDDKKTNLRQWCVRRNIFSKEVVSLLVLSNVVSVVLGIGLGYATLIRRFL